MRVWNIGGFLFGGRKLDRQTAKFIPRQIFRLYGTFLSTNHTPFVESAAVNEVDN